MHRVYIEMNRRSRLRPNVRTIIPFLLLLASFLSSQPQPANGVAIPEPAKHNTTSAEKNETQARHFPSDPQINTQLDPEQPTHVVMPTLRMLSKMLAQKTDSDKPPDFKKKMLEPISHSLARFTSNTASYFKTMRLQVITTVFSLYQRYLEAASRRLQQRNEMTVLTLFEDLAMQNDTTQSPRSETTAISATVISSNHTAHTQTMKRAGNATAPMPVAVKENQETAVTVENKTSTMKKIRLRPSILSSRYAYSREREGERMALPPTFGSQAAQRSQHQMQYRGSTTPTHDTAGEAGIQEATSDVSRHVRVPPVAAPPLAHNSFLAMGDAGTSPSARVETADTHATSEQASDGESNSDATSPGNDDEQAEGRDGPDKKQGMAAFVNESSTEPEHDVVSRTHDEVDEHSTAVTSEGVGLTAHDEELQARREGSHDGHDQSQSQSHTGSADVGGSAREEGSDVSNGGDGGSEHAPAEPMQTATERGETRKEGSQASDSMVGMQLQTEHVHEGATTREMSAAGNANVVETSDTTMVAAEQADKETSEKGSSEFVGVPYVENGSGENITQLSLMVYKIAKTEQIKSMAVAPCREVKHWMPAVAQRLDAEIHGFELFCVDIADEKGDLEDLKAAYGSISGAYIQTTAEDLGERFPRGIDLVVSWMGIQKWGLRKSWRFIKGLRRSGARMCLLGNNPVGSNAQMESGIVNVRKSPMLFNEPLRVIGKVSQDDQKQLLLYAMDKLRDDF